MSNTVIKPQPHENTRYKQLDSLRGLAAVAVFFSHYFGVIQNLNLSVLASTPVGVLFNGAAAVKFFFVLSGFVLSLPFMSKERPFKLIEFYVKRIFRIYPAYILTLIIALAFKYFVFDASNMVKFSDWVRGFWNWGWDTKHIIEIFKAFFLIGPKFDNTLINPATWSLAVEMRMSLFLPFFILIVAKSNFNFNSLFFFVLCVCTYNTKMEYLNIFYLGIYLAKYKDYFVDKVKNIPTWLTLTLALIALLFYNSNYEYFKVDPEETAHLKYYLRDIIIGAGSCIFIVLSLASKKVSKLLSRRMFVLLGDISYSFYLIHMPLLFTACSLFNSGTVIDYLFILIFTLFGGLFISILVYNYIEIPFQQVGKAFLKRFKILGGANLVSPALAKD